jgi:hypothetical protein
MSYGRTGLSWAAAALWFVGGMLLLPAGFFYDVGGWAATASLVVAMLVAAAPVKPITLLSTFVAFTFALIAVYVAVAHSWSLAVAAAICYAAAASFSFAAHRYEPQPHS